MLIVGQQEDRADERSRLGRVLTAKDAVNQGLSLHYLAIADQRVAEQVSESPVVAVYRFQRREQIDDLFVLAQPDLTIGQNQNGGQTFGLIFRYRGYERRHLGGGLGEQRRLVIGESQVVPDRLVALVARESLFVLGDRIFVSSEPRVSRAKVGTYVAEFRPLCQNRQITANRPFEVARLV